MKIGIVTVYDTMNNYGSFLQAFALKTFLEELGHDVFFVENMPIFSEVKKLCFKINPKREFLLRIKKCTEFLRAFKKIKIIKQNQLSNLDLIIYGSDEIWNMDNISFKDPFYFGTNHCVNRKVAYAMSIGEMEKSTLTENIDIAKGIYGFERIFVRDYYTKNVLDDVLSMDLKYVCDPTMLVPLSSLSMPVKCPEEKYIFIYSYGVDEPLKNIIIKFAREHKLKIVSSCFWDIWYDEVVQCSPLQFSHLIKNAEYVFTSTFHGAIFTMLNHKKCCILPVRKKVKDVVSRMGAEEKLIDYNCSYQEFCDIMNKDFPADVFEKNLKEYRNMSRQLLEEALNV